MYLNWIDGRWVEGSTGQWDINRNPARPTEILGRSTRSAVADVHRAIDAATLAQKKWAQTPRPVRGALLGKAAQVLRSKVDALAQELTAEEGKNIKEARGEVLKAANALEFTASEGRRPVGDVIPSELQNTFLYTTRVPLGVVGIITPWNFPVCIPAWKIGPALLEGNAVIFKPATLTPASAVGVVRAFEEAGIPPGLLNLVFGSGDVVGNAILTDPRVRAISFTGSNDVGKTVYRMAAERFMRVQLEMGGKNPIIVLADADLDQAADATVQGAFGSTGQRCTATSRAIVEESVLEPFTQKVLSLVRTLKVGDGAKDPDAIGPVVDEKQMKTVLQAIETGKREGARLLCGGERIGGDDPNAGYFVSPTVFDRVSPEMQLAQKEIFGPVLAIISTRNFEQAIEIANQVEYGLSSSLYTKDVQRVMQYADQMETGILHINSPTVGGETQAPFGGVKATGIGGREMGSTGPEFFSEIKTVYLDYNSTVRKGNLY